MRIPALVILLFAPAVHAEPAPLPATLLSDAELRRALETAPADAADQPGLYSLRLSPPSEPLVIGIRRTEPGMSELHANFTDVWYVVEGAGTVVTGGTITGGADIAPGEVRGRGIENGSPRRVQRGEFAVIPASTPHWISDIEGEEFLYIVIKVAADH